MLKVGFSRLDVTPPLGNDLAGYFVRRIADGILDPLYLNTVAIQNGNDTLLLMAVDYIGVKLAVCDEIRALISASGGAATCEECGISEELKLDAVKFGKYVRRRLTCMKLTDLLNIEGGVEQWL